MRHSDGLRAAAQSGLPAIGDAYQGGFFAGTISHTANGVATHLLIVAPAATGASGTGYTLTTNRQWKTASTATTGTTSTFNGSVNSANMNNASHPAAQFCEGLSIGGYSDWYLPAQFELEIAYYNLKPTTASNYAFGGVNIYAVPARSSNWTSGTPAQTTVTAFQSGNSEAFPASLHWASTQSSTNTGYGMCTNFNVGETGGAIKTDPFRVRAFRKVAL